MLLLIANISVNRNIV